MGHYYKTCPECGAALDPGEKCDCRRTPAEKKKDTMQTRRRMGLYDSRGRLIRREAEK